MGNIKDTADNEYRDFLVAGVPASGPNEPAKSGIRNLFGLIDVAVAAAQAGLATVATIADRNTFYATPENQTKLVYVNNNNGSANDPANGVYEYVNGVARIAQGFYNGVASVVQPLVDEARSIVNSPDVRAINGLAVFDPDGKLADPMLYLPNRFYAIRGGVTTDAQSVPSTIALTANADVVQVLAVDPSAGAAALYPFPFSGLPTNALVAGAIWQKQFTTQLPYAKPEQIAKPNLFYDGKTMTGALITGGGSLRAITAQPLLDRGFVNGVSNTGLAAAGGNFPVVPAIGQRIYFRWYVETDTDNAFGNPAVFLWQTSTFVQKLTGTMEKQLSARAAIFSCRYAVSIANLHHFYASNENNSGPRVSVTGIQYAIDATAPYILLADYPATASPSGLSFDVTKFAVPDELWLQSGKHTTFYIDNLSGSYTGTDLVATLSGDVALGTEGARTVSFRVNEPVQIETDRIDTSAMLTIRTARAPWQEWRKSLAIRKAPATAAKTVAYAQIGDSLTNRYIPTNVVRALKARGLTQSASIGVGTINSLGGAKAEGREGKQWGEHTYQLTSLQPVTDVSAYNALSDADKMGYNPFIRPAVSGDDQSLVFNGYIFDYAFYLQRFGLVTPTHVVIALGTNDISYSSANALNYCANGARVMIQQILAVNSTIKVGLMQHAVARSAEGDSRWAQHNALQRQIIGYLRSLANSRVTLLPSYAHQSRDAGWAVSASATASDTGLQTVAVADSIHFDPPNQHLAAEIIANWIIAS